LTDNGITIIPSLVKIGQIVQKLKGRHTHRKHAVSEAYYFRKEVG
jgi:hypothetical protein